MNKRQKKKQMKQAREAKALPVGMKEFETWSERIITAAGIPVNDSTRFAVATIILHAKEDAAELPDSYFVDRLRKSASNQVAAAFMHEAKERQKAEQEAAAKAEQSAGAV